MMSSTPMRTQMTEYIKALQQSIVKSLESLDPSRKFLQDSWTREAGGFGTSCVLAGGEVLEKAGVNISVVHGSLPPAAVKQMRVNHQELPEDGGNGTPFFAAGISLVIHPRNPMAPTVHANYRYFEVGTETDVQSWWFGGGSDLTPSYLFEEDCVHFHQTLRDACGNKEIYNSFKKWCDEYFYIPHRKESRGIGGIFFDDLNGSPHPRLPSDINRPTTQPDIFAFVKRIGDSFVPSYLPILERRHSLPYNDHHRRWQLLRRGRYVEFNLVYDRGTKFGLNTPSARIESILMSLPETARWEYMSDMGTSDESEEGQLQAVLKTPKDWI